MSAYDGIVDLLDRIERDNADLREKVRRQAAELQLTNNALKRRNSEADAFKKQAINFVKENESLREENDKLRELASKLHTRLNYRTVFGYTTDLDHLIEEIEKG